MHVIGPHIDHWKRSAYSFHPCVRPFLNSSTLVPVISPFSPRYPIHRELWSSTFIGIHDCGLYVLTVLRGYTRFGHEPISSDTLQCLSQVKPFQRIFYFSFNWFFAFLTGSVFIILLQLTVAFRGSLKCCKAPILNSLIDVKGNYNCVPVYT